jgi:hypothetical protein
MFFFGLFGNLLAGNIYINDNICHFPSHDYIGLPRALGT